MNTRCRHLRHTGTGSCEESITPHDKRRCGKTRIAATSKLQEVLLVVKVQMDDAVVVSLLTPVDDARPLGILIKVEEEVVTD